MSTDIEREEETNVIVRECVKEAGEYTLRDRAIPDYRDGLKPSQRRILFGMKKLGAVANSIPVKCAKVTGLVTGDYHPHGDAACYDTLVHLADLRYPLILGDGNFGDRDMLKEQPPAPQRYTECRLQTIAAPLFDDLHVAPMTPNYNETLEEPVFLPSPLPLLLLNGVRGIAFGLRTQIPPHNLREVVQATIHLIQNPQATTEDLLRFIKGPDYGSGVLLSNKAELLDLYQTGKGRLSFRCNYHVEDTKRTGIKKLVITGLSPGVPKETKSGVLTVTENLYKQKLIDSPVNFESTLEVGYRDTIEYRDAQIVRDRILPILDTTDTYQWYALDDTGQPQLYTLLGYLQDFIASRRKTETKVLNAEGRKLTEQYRLEVARWKAIEQLDEVVQVLKTATSDEAAQQALMSLLEIRVEEATTLLNTQLRSLMRLKQEAVVIRIKELQQKITVVKAKLQQIDAVIIERLETLAKKYGDDRKMKLRSRTKDFGEDAFYWIGVTESGKVDATTELPLRSKAQWPYIGFVRSSGEVTIVHDNNQAVRVSISYLDKYEPSGKVVGISADPYCLVVTKGGRYVLFATEQKRKAFPVIRDLGDDEIGWVVGLTDDSEVCLQKPGGELSWSSVKQLKVTRPNVKARKLFEVTELLSVPKEVQLVSPSGDELGYAEFAEELLAAGEQNLVCYLDGKRAVKQYTEVLRLLLDFKLATVTPLPKVDNDE